MIIVLSDLPSGPTPVVFDVTPLPDGPGLDGPARLEGELRVAERIELVGRLEGRLRLECCRCLDPFVLPVGLPVALRIAGDGSESGPDEAAMRLEDAALIHAREGRVDLSEVARELLELEVPLKPVCADSCRGLCPGCGENRNRIECGCESEAVDPRLAPLKDLRRRFRS